jgi:OCT family organic cation transporter-like MFS transporter 4/5
MLGKIGIAAAFAVIYVWSAEIFPTVVRNAGMGSSSAFARVGGMVSPYIADIVSNTCTYVFVLFLIYIFKKLVFMFSFSR